MINLTNLKDHPHDPHRMAYFFKHNEHANYFEGLLVEYKIKYEKHVEEEINYFIIKKSDRKTTDRLNYLCIGKFRKPFIPDKLFGYVLIVISFLILALAITGAVVSNYME